MDHNIVKRVIIDMRELIQNVEIVDRDYFFEKNANYILVGVRRSGKSYLMYRRVRKLIESGCEWNQICYVNFEDDRLTGFRAEEFDDILETAHEFTDQKIYYFFDEIQNVEGWERFARRLADHKEQVYITGSNASMLSSEMEGRLGGRYISMMIMPFSLSEVLDYRKVLHGEQDLLSTAGNGRIRGMAEEYMLHGGLPETLDYSIKRTYIQNVYDKVLLGDIIARNRLNNPKAMQLLMKKIAETVTQEVSYNKLAGAVKACGLKFSTDAAIRYTGYAEDAYLLFRTRNYASKFAEKESRPRFYYVDNGFLSLFLVNKDAALLANAVADRLYRLYGDDVYYFRSAAQGIDIDFYLPSENTAIQVTYSLNDDSYKREIDSLIKLRKHQDSRNARLMIVTYEQEDHINVEDTDIDVIPLYKFLLMNNIQKI